MFVLYNVFQFYFLKTKKASVCEVAFLKRSRFGNVFRFDSILTTVISLVEQYEYNLRLNVYAKTRGFFSVIRE